MKLDITPQGAEIMAARIAQLEAHIDGLEQQMHVLLTRNAELFEECKSQEHRINQLMAGKHA